MDDKRKFARVPISTEIWIGQDGIFTRTPERLRDLSEGGTCVETRQRFSVGNIFNLGFTLPASSHRISCSVLVRNLRSDSGLGVEFLDLSAEDRYLIRTYIEEQAALS